MTLKLNIGESSGKCYKRDLSEEESKALMGKKIGDKVKGDGFGLAGYEFEITGGSDNAGFPMRKDLRGAARKKILTTKSVGFRAKRKGERQRRTVSGNTISGRTVQVNMKVLKAGKGPLAAAAPAAESKAPAEKPKKAPAEKAKEKPVEAKPTEAAPEAPAEKSEAGGEEKKAEKAPAEKKKAEEAPAKEKKKKPSKDKPKEEKKEEPKEKKPAEDKKDEKAEK
ncbi:30S ribosomal protein S6e [Nanoarchaeota archaeon]